MTTGPFFIDFEAFQHEGETIIKELCIMECNRPLLPIYYIFSPPYDYKNIEYPMKKSISWQTKNFHYLHWSEGDRIFCPCCVMRHIKEIFPAWDLGIFYVMESVIDGPKVKTLKDAFPLLDIVNYNVTFKSLPPVPANISCFYREHGDHCAYLKCMRMLQHYTDSKYNV